MTDIPKDAKCSQEAFSVWGSQGCCSKPAKVNREGRLYCGIHDPVRLKEKRDANTAKWRAENEANRLRNQQAVAKQAAFELDAARYRWLRMNPAWESEMALMGMTPEQFDAAIDAAMKG